MSAMALMDTHVLVWYVTGHRSLGRHARRLIQGSLAAGGLFASAVTFWELATLGESRRLRLPGSVRDFRDQVLHTGVREHALDGAQVIRATEVLGANHEFFDRFILAAAESLDATLITADEKLLAWAGRLARCDAQT